MRTLFAFSTTLFWLVATANGHELQLDFTRTNGSIRPLHGVNLGPLCYRGTVDLSEYHRELAIPFTRLHDVVWVNAEAVDIHTVFPDAHADPARPESYRFAATDDYLAAIVKVGSRIVYRLGESIEHTPRKYHVHPPADPRHWAAVCLGIVRHYNEGWAAGFRHEIPYWEIWNEPDIRPQMWTGNDAQFFELFAVTAKAIKQAFPALKVGGPGIGNTGQLTEAGLIPSAFLTNFLGFCRRENVPLDFLSWHCYTSEPRELIRRAQGVRRLLDSYGLAATESHLNEWNYLPRNDWRPMLRDGQGRARQEWYAEMHSPAGAAFLATALLLFQDVPIDVANYYTGEIQGFGLFTFEGEPKKTFYAAKAFRELWRTPLRVVCPNPETGDPVCAAGVAPDTRAATVLISHRQAQPHRCTLDFRQLPWKGPGRFQIWVVDAAHDLGKIREGQINNGTRLDLPLPTPGVLLLRLEP